MKGKVYKILTNDHWKNAMYSAGTATQCQILIAQKNYMTFIC